MNFGEKLQAIRKDKKMTQKELAKKCGCSVISIGRYESGERSPSFEVINNIAAVFGMTSAELLSEVEITVNDGFSDYITTMPKYTKPKNKLLEAFDKLNAAGKETAAQRVYELTLIKQYTEPDGQEPPF